ncbi:hypothetical protein BGZ97_011713 [Linnemannia gamsii]|uniref:Pal1-domain-containing protein n=1 Tax=Linnemannia gamsii TaxID=64522 RepID=A0A9P6R331_9FUNG|nr:hypothetical protein BGZ97_011713 [Linnemannia gamsii]
MKIHFISLPLLLGATAALGSGSSLNTDNSHGNCLFRVDYNGNSSARKEGELFGLQRRSLVNSPLGSDKTNIQNINDNSNHAQTMSTHGNTHTTTTTITRIHKEPSPEAEQWIRQSGFFNHHVSGPLSAVPVVVSNGQDADEHGRLLDRRGLLWGRSATTISNVNDNSQSTKTYNYRGNMSKKITKVISKAKDNTGSPGHSYRFDKREEKEEMEMLDNPGSRIQSPRRRTLYKFDSTHRPHPQPQDQGDDTGSNLIDKRATTTTLTTTTTTAIVEFEDDDKVKKSKKVDDIARRNLVTIQIITQNTNTNTNGHSIDNSSSNNNNVYPVKVIQQGNNNDKKKKRKNKGPPHHRPSPPVSKKSKKPVARSNQPKSHGTKYNQSPKKSMHATKSSNGTKKTNNKSRRSHDARQKTN